MRNQAEFLIPDSPEAITAEWLSDVLRSRGKINSSVTAVSVELAGTGTGFGSRSARLHIQYDGEQTGAPATLFAKLSLASTRGFERQRLRAVFEAEAGFYRDIADKCGIRTPKPYLSLWNEATGDSMLLLEDIGHARFGDNLTGCSNQDAELVLTRLAEFHAQWWNNSGLEEFSWLHTFDYYSVPGVRLYTMMLEARKERIREVAPDWLVDLATSLADQGPLWFSKISSLPRTFVHGDTRLDNFAFEVTPERTDLILFDWQLPRIGPAAIDVAYFMTYSLPVDQRRACERDLLSRYHSELVRHGVQDYSREELQQDYRLSLGKSLMTLVNAIGLLDLTNARASALAAALTKRVSAALEDHQFTELLTGNALSVSTGAS